MIQRDIDRVLKYCNQFRVEMGMEPLDDLCKGLPKGALQCPIAKSINHDILVRYNRLEPRSGSPRVKRAVIKVFGGPLADTELLLSVVPLPAVMREFIKEFDCPDSALNKRYHERLDEHR